MILFSDESYLCSTKSGIEWIRKKPNEQYTEKMIKFLNQGSSKKVMIWGMISSNGPVDFVRIDGKYNS